MVQRTQANARRLLGLINDVLDISRIEAGRMELVPTALNVVEYIGRVRSQMEVLAREKQLGFHVEIAPGVPSAILIDEDALTKILVNLLSNAIKFTDEGGVNLTLRAENGQMIIKVTDTGIGIPVYMHEVIFERFRQVDGSSTRKHGGSGLGLSIVQQLCHLMDGQVNIDSDTGRGSTFTVTLPLQPVAQVEAAA
jgi:signal transduction histidine kinase